MKYLFLLLLCFSQPALAQRSRAYWEANPDSLLRVATRQTADTARLRTFEHSVRVMGLRRAEVIEVLASITALAKQLHRPEYAAYRQVLAAQQLNMAASYLQDSLNRNLIRPPLAAQRAAARTERFNRLALDSVKGGLRQFDALGSDQPMVLSTVRLLFGILHQPEEERAYVEAQLAFYRRRGMVMSIADCCNVLAGSYMTLGDYNRSISYALEAADLYEPLTRKRQQAMLMVAGSGYSSWENDKKAIFYFQRALKGADFGLRATIYNELGLIYRDEKRYEEALAAADQAQRDATSAIKSKQRIQGGLQQLMSALNQKCLALIALKRLPEVDQLLPKVQALGDSIMRARDTGNTVYNNYETWAKYYAAHGQWQQATAARQASYKEALEDNSLPEQLFCLRALAEVYDAQGKATQTAFYAMAALKIERILRVKQNGFNVAYYEQQTVERRQAARIAGLRQTQARAEAQAHQQRTALGWLLGGLSALVGLALWQGRSYRRQQRANALLAAQKAQIEEQAVRLGELDEAKNQFFANVSHELRTPLTLVLGPLDTLLTDPTQALPAAAQVPVALAYRQAQRLLELVNRILDLTKLQAGRLALHPKPTLLAALLRRVVTQFESLATQRGISLLGPAALPDGLRVLLDADKVEEVLTNLLINALNHTPAGGTVQVTAALPGPDGYYHVTVQDTGSGIAPAEQARVFERFYQSPQAQAQGGTGLGLALSRELAALLGGTLALVSEPGQGAAFTLRFPAPVLPTETASPVAAGVPTEVAPASESSRLSAGSARPRPRVLVVEDQPDLREYLRSLLAPTCEVLTAADGQAALDLLAHADPVDLITTDVMMPRLNGTELLARLRADPAQQQVPVLMLTARADDAHRLAALTLGVDDYLTKPFARTELLARVQALLARHQVRRHFATLPPEPEEAAPAAVAAAPEPAARTPRVPPPVAASQLAEWQARVSERLGDEQFGPGELAELLCLSERTLYRRLGELAGLTPAAWLRELRLDWARRLLEAGTHRSVAEVADTVGFASPKYFATLYAERFGRRPADYHS